MFGCDIDVVIFLAYLAINLMVGLFYGRNVKTIQDYALGGRYFTTGALVATIVGTWASGSGFFITLSKVYSDGIYYVIAYSFWVLQLILIAFVFAPRMGEFLGKVSIAEAMGELYSKDVRLVVAIAGICSAIGIIAVQFKACGYIFEYFVGIDPAVAVITSGVIVTIYSAFGGIRAITFADVLQCITFGVAIPLVGILIWHSLNINGFDLHTALQNPKFNIHTAVNIHNPQFLAMLPLMFYFMIPSLEPAFVQRIMIGSGLKQIKKAFIISAGLLLFVKLSTAWIPFLLFSVNPDLDPGQLLPYIVDSYSYVGLKGLVIIGIMALAMSTADAHINSASVLFAHDLCSQCSFGNIKELLISRLFASFLGIAAVCLALSKKDILDIVLTAQGFYMPIVTTPLIVTILGFRSSAKSVLIGMGAGFLTVIIWKSIGIKMDCIVFAMVVNLIFLLGSHYLLRQPGGWVGVKDRRFLDQEAKDNELWISNIKKQIREFTILGFITKFAPKNELMYSGFGIYCIICTFVTMYISDSELTKDSSRVMMYCYQTMLVTGTMIGSFPIWPQSIKKEIIMQIWWPFALFYILGFFSAFFLMVTHFDGLGFAVFTINTMIALTIAGWRMGSLMIISGFYFASIAYQAYADTSEIGIYTVYSNQSIFMYLFLLLGAAVVVFFKPKEDYAELVESKIDYLQDESRLHKKEISALLDMKNEFLRNIEHESRTPITGITSMAEVLDEAYDKLTEKQKRNAIKDIAQSSERLNSWANNLVNLSRLSAGGNIERAKVNLSELIGERLAICTKLHIDEKDIGKRVFVMDLSEDITVNCDKHYISSVVDNLITNAIQYCVQGEIKLVLKSNNSSVEFSISDEGIGVSAEDIYDIFGLFIASSKTKTTAGGRGIGLALCKKVIELHGGKIWAESDGVTGSTFRFTIPY